MCVRVCVNVAVLGGLSILLFDLCVGVFRMKNKRVNETRKGKDKRARLCSFNINAPCLTSAIDSMCVNYPSV